MTYNIIMNMLEGMRDYAGGGGGAILEYVIPHISLCVQ